ncbi:hypothetical protein CPC08DRAFT_710000 [Agrocybe pediades]|nr:hypothetical protein CPC08DRAFT_710000 [Agrocybe pediades]
MARGNGRGRGGNRGGHRGGRGGGYGVSGSSYIEDEIDFSIQTFANTASSTPKGVKRGGKRGGRGGGTNSTPNSSSTTPNRGRGRGRGGYDSPRGRGGYDSPRGRGRGQFEPSGRGRGIGSPRGGGRGGMAPNTLSGHLYLERPFLRPIKFVPSVLTKVLFQEEENEELLKPGVEEVDETEQSHIPTADRVFRVFSGRDVPPPDSDSDDDDEEKEEIEEVDFNEIDKLFSTTETVKTTSIRKSKLAETISTLEEQTFTGFYVDSKPTDVDVEDLAKLVDETLSTTDVDDAHTSVPEDVDMPTAAQEDAPPFTIDVIPSPIPEELAPSEATSPSTLREQSTDIPQEKAPAEATPSVEEPMDSSPLFMIDVQPTPVPAELAPSESVPPAVLRDQEEEDDIIVYVAPHPRKSELGAEETSTAKKAPTEGPDTSHFVPYAPSATLLATAVPPIQPPPSFSSVSFSFSQSATPSKQSRLVVPPLSTPRQAKVFKRRKEVVVKKKRAKTSFGAFGAMREEAMLHPRDPRKHERRRGDSDLDWGDSEDDNGSDVDEIDEGLQALLNAKMKDKGKGKAQDDVEDDHGMDVDPDLQPGMAAMQSFVGGLLGKNAGQHKTMDDAMIEDMIRREDEEEEDEGTSDDDSSEDESEEDVLAVEEAMLISESLEFEDDLKDVSDDSDDDSDEDEDMTPRTSFQARLERLRNKSRSRKVADTSVDDMADSDEDREDFLNRNMTWAEQDEDFIQEIHDMLDEHEDILKGKDRKKRNALFRSIQNGSFDLDDDDFGFTPAKKKKDKKNSLPAELQAQWDKDRAAKAERKKQRERERLENAADPMSKKKGGKKGRKAMLAAAALDPTITVLPNRIIDMVTLVQQIRRFINDLDGPGTMSLPPTNKETRKNVHEMAIAFNLKSVSKGKGDARYTTLTKTSRTGLNVDERKVAKIVRRSGGAGSRGDSFIYEKKSKVSTVMPRHREGEEVGKAAPKLTESNLGFRLLAMMGWSEGVRIGHTGGLDAPLTAIIKHTKLGLGATK